MVDQHIRGQRKTQVPKHSSLTPTKLPVFSLTVRCLWKKNSETGSLKMLRKPTPQLTNHNHHERNNDIFHSGF